MQSYEIRTCRIAECGAYTQGVPMKRVILFLMSIMGLFSLSLIGCEKETRTAPEALFSSEKEAAANIPGDAAVMPAEGRDSGSALTAEKLLHRRFVLVSVDGEPFGGGAQAPEMEFLGGLRVAGGICNRFTGQGELAGEVLKVGRMAFTRMLCADENLNRVERLFATMLREGARVAVDENTLTLTHGGHTLGWKLRDKGQ